MKRSSTAAINGRGLSATHTYPARSIPDKSTVFGVVDIATRLWAGQPMNYSSFPGRRERIISFPDIQIGSEAHPPIQCIWGGGAFLGSKKDGASDHSLPSGAVVKDAWSCNLLSPCPYGTVENLFPFKTAIKYSHFNIISI